MVRGRCQLLPGSGSVANCEVRPAALCKRPPGAQVPAAADRWWLNGAKDGPTPYAWEQAMTFSGISFSNTRFAVSVRGDEGQHRGRQHAMRGLANALEAGDLESATRRFTELAARGPGRRLLGTDAVSTDLASKFAAVGAALASGDVGAAKDAFVAFRTALRSAGEGPSGSDMSIQPVPGDSSGLLPVDAPVQVTPPSIQPVNGATPVVPQIGAPASAPSAIGNVPQIGAPVPPVPAGSVPATDPATTPATAPGGSTPASYSLTYTYVQLSWSYGPNSGSFTQTGLTLNVTG